MIKLQNIIEGVQDKGISKQYFLLVVLEVGKHEQQGGYLVYLIDLISV